MTKDRPLRPNLRDCALAALLTALTATLAGCDIDGFSAITDLEGRSVDPLEGAPVTVALFIDSDCPVSNRYAPEIQRLHDKYAPEGVQFWLVYPDPDIGAETIRSHMNEFGYTFAALMDPQHNFVERAKAMVTPEAGIFLADGSLVYHGRIDNRYVDLTLRRPQATEHDVADVLDALIADKPVEASWTPAPGRSLETMSSPGVGCYIRDFK